MVEIIHAKGLETHNKSMVTTAAPPAGAPANFGRVVETIADG